MRGIALSTVLATIPVLITVLIPSLAGAQSPAPAPGSVPTLRIPGIVIPTIADAPFTATINLEWERTAPDGTHVRMGNQRAVARDRHGRVFQEQRPLINLTAAGSGAAQSDAVKLRYEDPFRQRQYICVVATGICDVQPFQPIPAMAAPTAAGNSGPGTAWEDLGTKTIEGFEVHGTRKTIAPAPGTVGNAQPVAATRESWFSPALGIYLLTIRKDAGVGTQTLRLTNIRQREPRAAMLRPPADYQIVGSGSEEAPPQQDPQ